MPNSNLPITLVGHPFAPIGMGEVLRSTFRSLRAAQLPVRIVDVYGMSEPDPDLQRDLGPFLTENVENGPNIFCINGDEVSPILAHLGARVEGGRRIIYPAWELPRYPDAWAAEIARFDEVWGMSAYTAQSLANSVSVPVHHLPLATEPRRPTPFGRRNFGIPENCFAFLFFFDLRSYVERKNPSGALEAFRRVVERRPDLDVRLVLKMNGADLHQEHAASFIEQLQKFRDQVVLINRTMTDAEVKALHLCCDAFVSLHRCEGYGFGPAEAMYFGKPTIATGYSGNMDFMTPETSRLIDFTLVPVPEDAYPHWSDQVWAEPSVDQAATEMIALADDPQAARRLGASASRHIRVNFSYRATGLRYAARLAYVDTQLAPIVRMDANGDTIVSVPKREVFAIAEKAAASGNINEVLAVLRTLSLEDFGRVLIAMPDPDYPGLSSTLPKMADESIQRDWTGNAGVPLLLQTLRFVRSVEQHFSTLIGRPLRDANILDYGCGYGRILRLMYYFSDPPRTFGIDPWDRSIEICRDDHLPSQLAVSDYLPLDLPVGETKFDLLYAFSVFTHTSERATRTALAALRKHVRSDGLLVLTIRPRDYWISVETAGHTNDTGAMLAAHDTTGFAFTAHGRAAVDGDVTYGDTSISLAWLTTNAEGWRVAADSSPPGDPLQIIAYLMPI